MKAIEFLRSDECPNIKSGFGLNDIQLHVLAEIMQAYHEKQLLIQRVVLQSEQLKPKQRDADMICLPNNRKPNGK